MPEERAEAEVCFTFSFASGCRCCCLLLASHLRFACKNRIDPPCTTETTFCACVCLFRGGVARRGPPRLVHAKGNTVSKEARPRERLSADLFSHVTRGDVARRQKRRPGFRYRPRVTPNSPATAVGSRRVAERSEERARTDFRFR